MKLFENKTFTLIPCKDFKLFADAAAFPSCDSAIGKQLCQAADETLSAQIPQLYASVYRRFAEDGNRAQYEESYFNRRRMLKKLLLGEIVQKQNKYTDKIIDIVWLILEETTWIIPAHNKFSYAEPNANPPLPESYDGNFNFIDLFSAETGALLALVYWFLKDKIEALAPCVNKRILYALRQRVFEPFLARDDMFWMGTDDEPVNNWNPWILSNILLCTACVEDNDERRRTLTNKSVHLLDNFIDGYAEDGGCNEGPHYWGEAAAGLFDALELLNEMTDGLADIFTHPLVYNMMDYIRKVHLCGNHFTNFADSKPALYPDGLPNAWRMAQRTNNAALYAFATQLTPQTKPLYIDYVHNNYRIFKNLCTPLPAPTAYTAAEFDVLPALQLAVWRKGSFCAAIKGGHNGESHNHNDVGSCIVLYKGKPVFIDIGAPTYTKDLFSDKRYTVFPTASQYHNLPILDGQTQGIGAEFAAEHFRADAQGALVAYTNAYPAANLHCTRKIEVTPKRITICETAKAQKSCLFQYYTVARPEPLSRDTFLVNGASVTFCTDCDCQVVPVPLSDSNIIENWKTDTLYKIIVRCGADASFSLKIEN